MVIYQGVEEYSGNLRCCTYVRLLHGGFLHVSVGSSIFFFDVVSDGGKVLCILYGVLYRVPYFIAFR
jgi:hypothetical protein